MFTIFDRSLNGTILPVPPNQPKPQQFFSFVPAMACKLPATKPPEMAPVMAATAKPGLVVAMGNAVVVVSDLGSLKLKGGLAVVGRTVKRCVEKAVTVAGRPKMMAHRTARVVECRLIFCKFWCVNTV